MFWNILQNIRNSFAEATHKPHLKFYKRKYYELHYKNYPWTWNLRSNQLIWKLNWFIYLNLLYHSFWDLLDLFKFQNQRFRNFLNFNRCLELSISIFHYRPAVLLVKWRTFILIMGSFIFQQHCLTYNLTILEYFLWVIKFKIITLIS